MINVSLKNFRVIRDAEIKEDKPLILVVGENESGKSSLLQGIRYAGTGSAYGRRGSTTNGLVTHGEKTMSVRVNVDDSLFFQRSTAGGTALKDVAASLQVDPKMLPLLFDSRVASDAGKSHLETFFATLGEVGFDPFPVFSNDEAATAALLEAQESGIPMGDIKKLVRYAEGQRAAYSRKPPKPMPPATQPFDEEAEAVLRGETTAKQERLATLQAELSKAKTMAHKLTAIATYISGMQEHLKAREVATGDALGPRRDALQKVLGLNETTLSNGAAILVEAGFEEVAAALQACVGPVAQCRAEAHRTLTANPLTDVPPAPSLNDACADLYRELYADIEKDPASLMAISEAAAKEELQLQAEMTQVSQELQAVNRQRMSMVESKGAWEAYEASIPNYDNQVAEQERAWAVWDRVVKGVETAYQEFARTQGSGFTSTMAKFASTLLDGREVCFDDTYNITVGGLPLQDLSESTKWRAEVAVMASVALYLGSPILLIDGADILDSKNRKTITEFLASSIVPHFKHTIVASTVRGNLADEQPLPAASQAVKYTVSNGVLTKLHPQQ